MSVRKKTGEKGYLLDSEGEVSPQAVGYYNQMISLHKEQTFIRETIFILVVWGSFVLYAITSCIRMFRN